MDRIIEKIDPPADEEKREKLLNGVYDDQIVLKRKRIGISLVNGTSDDVKNANSPH